MSNTKEYMRAETARSIAIEALKKVQQLETIIDIIADEAKNGKRSFIYKAHIEEITRNKLNELGYTVCKETGAGLDRSTEIKW